MRLRIRSRHLRAALGPVTSPREGSPRRTFGSACDDGASESLVGALEQLTVATDALNKRFFGTTDAAARLSGLGNELVRNCRRLVELASGGEEGTRILVSGMGLVEAPLAFLGRHQVESDQLLDRLRTDQDQIDTCLQAELQLQRVMTPLRSVKLLFSVVAAPLGAETQRVFASLMHELGLLHDRVQELFQTRFVELRAVRETLGRLTSAMKAEQCRWVALSEQRVEMEGTLKDLSTQLQANSRRRTRIADDSQQVAAAIDQLVTGLQWQDIFQQKAQHVEAAVNAIVAALREEGMTQTAGKAARLQAAQLRAMQLELADAERQVLDGLSGVSTTLRESDSIAVELTGIGHATTSSSGVVQTLLDIIASLDEHVQAALATAQNTLGAIEGIGKMASDLTTVVRDVSDRTQLLGLNAQIQAAKIASGAGLGVLSARTTEISTDVARISGVLATALDTVIKDLRTCLPICRASHEQAQKQLTEFRAGRASTEACLHGLRDEAQQLVQSIGSTLEEIGRLCDSAMAEAGYSSTMEAAGSRLTGVLDDLANAGVQGDFPPGSSSLVEEARRRFTTASELRVLESVGLGAPATAVAAASERAFVPASAPSGGPEVFADASSEGVEVFACSGSGAGPVDSNSSSDSDSSRKYSAPAKPTSASASNPSSDLGTGVELF